VVWVKDFILDSDDMKRYDLGIEFVQINKSDWQKISKYVFESLRDR
jgi:hypothetical protein